MIFFSSGFGENCRVLKYIFDRVEGKDVAVDSPVGLIPKEGSIDTKGLETVNFEELMSVPKDYWLEQLEDVGEYYEEQFGDDLPKELWEELNTFKQRLTEN